VQISSHQSHRSSYQFQPAKVYIVYSKCIAVWVFYQTSRSFQLDFFYLWIILLNSNINKTHWEGKEFRLFTRQHDHLVKKNP